MEDPKTSQASSSDTLSLDRNRRPIWDPIFQPQYLPNFRGYPFSACAGQNTSISSDNIHLPFPSTPCCLGAVGPKVGQKWGQLQN